MLLDVPYANELLVAIREFLCEEVVPQGPSVTAYNARIAANVLAQIERELELAPDAELRQVAGLAELGVADDNELALRLRSGAIKWNDPCLWGVLSTTTRDRLAIVNPAYAEADWLAPQTSNGRSVSAP